MRRRDQIFLPSRERVLILIALLPATTAAALLLRLAIFHLKRFHFDEVNVAGRFAVGIARFRVIGNEIAGLQIKFFEKESVGRGQRTGRFPRQFLKIHLFLVAAVD